MFEQFLQVLVSWISFFFPNVFTAGLQMAECMHTLKNNKELTLRQQFVVHMMKKGSGEAARPQLTDSLSLLVTASTITRA